MAKDEVVLVTERRWLRQLVEALVAVIELEVPPQERAGVFDQLAAQVGAARAEVLRKVYEESQARLDPVPLAHAGIAAPKPCGLPAPATALLPGHPCDLPAGHSFECRWFW